MQIALVILSEQEQMQAGGHANMKKQDNRVTRMKDFLYVRMSQMHSYHDHKETMAHAALLVSLGLVGAVLGTKDWPPDWVPSVSLWEKAVASIGVLTVWFLIHYYMRWELRNRRIAAMYVESFLKVLRNWEISPPENLVVYVKEKDQPTGVRFHRAIDHFIPWKRSNVIPDDGLEGYPVDFVNELKQSRSGCFKGEAIVSYGSLLLGLLLLVRMLIYCFAS